MSSPSKIVLITGASSGLGMETAKLLASTGFEVYGKVVIHRLGLIPSILKC